MAYKILKSTRGVPEDDNKCEILIESASDIANFPDDLSPGSVAYTADFSVMKMKDIDGSWVQMGG